MVCRDVCWCVRAACVLVCTCCCGYVCCEVVCCGVWWRVVARGVKYCVVVRVSVVKIGIGFLT